MKKRTQFFSAFITVCLTLAMLSGLTWLVEKKDSYAKHAEFFEQEAAYDVFFFGSSHIMNAVMPMKLWHDYGIVSYNWAEAGHPLPSSYWVMRQVLQKQTPKLVVIDCQSVNFDIKTSNSFGLMHISMDSLPLSLTKISAVRDLLDDPSLVKYNLTGEERSAFNLLWPFPVFHERWSQLTNADFHPEKNYSRGSLTNDVVVTNEFKRTHDLEPTELDAPGADYLRRMIEECQNHGIEVLLTWLPYPASEWDQQASEYVVKIASEYGVPYINYLDLDVVDYSIDYADSNHVNLSGAQKITDHLGAYLCNHYRFPDHRGDADYENWTRDYPLFVQRQVEALLRQDDLYQYLMLLSEDDLDAFVFLRNEDIFLDPLAADLLKNLDLEEKLFSGEQERILFKVGRRPAFSGAPVWPEASEGDSIKFGQGGFSIPASDSDLSVIVFRDGNPVDSVGFSFLFDQDNGRIVQTGLVREKA